MITCWVLVKYQKEYPQLSEKPKYSSLLTTHMWNRTFFLYFNQTSMLEQMNSKSRYKNLAFIKPDITELCKSLNNAILLFFVLENSYFSLKMQFFF